MYLKNCILLLVSFLTCAALADSQLTLQPQSQEKYRAQIKLNIPQDDFIYTDYLDLSCDSAEVTVTSWHCEDDPLSHFDRSFKEHKKAYQGPVTLTAEFDCANEQALQDAHILVSYYQASRHQLVQESIELAKNSAPETLATSIDILRQAQDDRDGAPSSFAKAPADRQDEREDDDSADDETWAEYLSDLLISTNSRFLQLLIIFLLGLLMSLTPCIYPMIPITAGILQTQTSRSLFTNFLLSLSYTFGVATTFAVLGLLAAFTGTALGSLMVQPWFLFPIIALLIYLALSMLGFYEIYIPRFLQPSGKVVASGSYVSSFIFGAVSGSVASPCLSPGLVLLLSIVAAMKNLYLGFIMLFIFGIGLSIPLLIIGTFSSSLNVLPRAGMWMNEIKKLFGLLLFGMCFYFLSFIVSGMLVLWMVTFFVLISGVLYLKSAQHTSNKTAALIKNVIGIILVATSVALIFKSYQTVYLRECPTDSSNWYTDFQCAHDIAQHKQTLLFVDIGAPYCSLCKALDKTLFADEQVIQALKNFTTVRLDGSREENKALLKRYRVFGFPTILIIDPKDEALLRKWGSDLYGIDPEDFINALESI